ncbi:UNVERIFIED_CONTAM: hypothetical protein GTU68_023692 [Idotea baltica]|nr:hypothetical protein [Idotea baltica]
MLGLCAGGVGQAWGDQRRLVNHPPSWPVPSLGIVGL